MLWQAANLVKMAVNFSTMVSAAALFSFKSAGTDLITD